MATDAEEKVTAAADEPEPTTPEGAPEGAPGEPAGPEHVWQQEKQERAQSRWSQIKQEREAALKRAEDTERRYQEDMRRWEQQQHQVALELAELKGRLSATDAGRKVDDFEANVQRLEKQAYERYQAGDYDGAREVERRLRRIEASHVAEELLKSRGNAQQFDPIQMTLQAEFPWVTTNAKARRMADGYLAIAEGESERPLTIDDYRHACRQAEQKLGISRPRVPPAPATQQRPYGAVPSRDTGASDGPRPPTDQEREMAERAGISIDALMAVRRRNAGG